MGVIYERSYLSSSSKGYSSYHVQHWIDGYTTDMVTYDPHAKHVAIIHELATTVLIYTSHATSNCFIVTHMISFSSGNIFINQLEKILSGKTDVLFWWKMFVEHSLNWIGQLAIYIQSLPGQYFMILFWFSIQFSIVVINRNKI